MSTSSSHDAIFISFKENAPLWNFLLKRNHPGFGPRGRQEEEKKYTYAEIENALSQIIEKEKLYDETNPAIVICNKALEEALEVKAFHISELKSLLSKQFQYIKYEPCTEFIVRDQQHQVYCEEASPISLEEPTRTNDSSQCSPKKEKAVQSSKSPDLSVEGSFVISPELRNTFNCLPDFKKGQSLFKYSEILGYLSKYIIKNRQKFFDPKNVKVAFIQNDPLEKAFKVKTFHRLQVTALLDREISRVPTISEVKVEDLTMEKENEGAAESSSGSTTDLEGDRAFLQSISHGPKRKISPEDYQIEGEELNTAYPPKRVRRLSTLTVSVLRYESSDEETIYSAQGYETVAMSEKSDHAAMVSNSNSSDDEDAMVYSAEYEINDSNESIHSESEDSNEDSELEDVVLSVTVFDLREDENDEFWADSESNIDDDNNYSDCLDSKSEDIKCCKCGKAKNMILLYCEGCWLERKESCPQREHPRKKRARAVIKLSNDEIPLVEQSKSRAPPAFNRSTSITSTTSSGMSRHYESSGHDSGVSSQDILLSEKSPDISSEDNYDSESVYTNTAASLKKRFRAESPQRESNVAISPSSEGCPFCFRRPKNATLIHGNIGHTICCYPCAKKLWKDQQPCPICRRKIEKFVRNIEA